MVHEPRHDALVVEVPGDGDHFGLGAGPFWTYERTVSERAVDGSLEVTERITYELAIPGWGWLALDPTNAQQVGQRHITIGHGRDYDDVPPVRGVFSGAGRPSTDALVEIRRHSQVVQQIQAQQQ